MGAGYGFASVIGLAKQNSGGANPIAVTNHFEALNESVSTDLDRFDVINMAGRFQEPDDIDGVKRIEGDIVFATQPEIVGFFLLGAMGVNSITEVASGSLWKHEFTMRNEDWDARFAGDPFTFEIFRDVGSSQQYQGTVINQLQFNVAPNQDLRCTATVIAVEDGNIEKTTVTFVSSPSEPFTFDTASLSVAGVGIPDFESFTITINNVLEGVPSLNSSKLIQKIRRTDFQQIRVSGDLAFEDIVEYNNFRNQTNQTFKLNLFKSASFSILFDMPKVVYSSFPLGVGGRDRQVIGFDGIARFNTGSNQAIKVDLTNTRSFY